MGFSSLQEKVLEGQNKSSLLLCCHKTHLPLNILLASPSTSATSIFQCSDLYLKEQTNPRGIKKDPQGFHSSGLGFGRAELQHSSEQQTPLSECNGETTGEHLGKTTFSPLYALCCLGGTLPAGLNWLWQRFWSCRSQGWGSRDGSITLLCRDQLQDKSLEGSGWALLRPQVLQGIGKAVAVQSSLCQTVKKRQK